MPDSKFIEENEKPVKRTTIDIRNLNVAELTNIIASQEDLLNIDFKIPRNLVVQRTDEIIRDSEQVTNDLSNTYLNALIHIKRFNQLYANFTSLIADSPTVINIADETEIDKILTAIETNTIRTTEDQQFTYLDDDAEILNFKNSSLVFHDYKESLFDSNEQT